MVSSGKSKNLVKKIKGPVASLDRKRQCVPQSALPSARIKRSLVMDREEWYLAQLCAFRYLNGSWES